LAGRRRFRAIRTRDLTFGNASAITVSRWPGWSAISGIASAEQAFRLAQLGVRAYLAKPFSLDDLTAAVERILQEAPEFAPLVRASVGRVPMRELQGRVRHLMIDQALARAEGSRSGAARLLDVSRQAVQQVARQRADDSSKEPEDGDAGVKAGQP
jgi:DNA-binding NtrC family response regulator